MKIVSFLDPESSKNKSLKDSTKGLSLNSSREVANAAPSKDPRRLVPIRTDDRSINLDTLKQASALSPKKNGKKSSPLKSRSTSKRKPSVNREQNGAKVENNQEGVKPPTRSVKTSNLMMAKAKEEKIAKLKQDLNIPNIKFREIKDGGQVEEEEESHHSIESPEPQIEPEVELSEIKKGVEAKVSAEGDFDYSGADSDEISNQDSRVSVDYQAEPKEINEDDYLRELLKETDEDLEAIEDVKKRQEIKAYRKMKRAQVEEELKIDGSLSLFETTDQL